ncbi:hypothetical protein HR15_08000 [Porphyromonas gulae]|uniref:Uncharacterized protein n=1 Tax=Porphyromonas gulae TaxID=111105 RepID=A0A0A2F5V0_9PORP|nr:hypothetical protein HR15_08000 [Porphyromonas gulae]
MRAWKLLPGSLFIEKAMDMYGWHYIPEYVILRQGELLRTLLSTSRRNVHIDQNEENNEKLL